MKIDNYSANLVALVKDILQEQDNNIEKLRQEDEEALQEVYNHELLDEYRTPYLYELTDREYSDFCETLENNISEIICLLLS